MNCRACGAPLLEGSRYCPACGSPVHLGCPSCGSVVPVGARYCPRCGTPLDRTRPQPADASALTAAAPPEPASPGRERKVATLLFADLVGFTSLGESLDPEVVGALVGDVFARLGAEVARYEGTVEKFAGDAMLAVFGVPSIHEDDPERAVRAGLEMQAAMLALDAELRAAGRPAPALRIGIESGEVLVDLARAAVQRDLFVTGDAVNTAARLQQAAAPGTVVVGPGAYAATRHVVDYEELEPAVLKGKAVPVAAWRAVAVKARRGGRRAPLGIEAPIVGREEEVALLKETVRRSVADGRPHLVTIVGAAGVGKSRLSWELEKYLDGLPETYHWRKGRCLAYAQASYSALADVIKADARIMDDDAPSTAIAKLSARVAEVHGAGADPAVIDSLRAVLALGPIEAVAREELFEAWRRHLDGVARVAPLVLVLEDIHWADEGLLDVIEFLARWGEGPTTIVCLARHELLERRPSWGGGTLNASTIVLEPLDPAENERLVDGLLGSAVPRGLRDRIVALADGNPLFSEELVRMFVDRGVLRFVDGRWELAGAVDEIAVPGSIQAVLAARLDGLPSSEKRLAQNAAVVGRIFWDAVLAHLSRMGKPATIDLLRRLRVKELVVPREPSSLAGAAEFGFRHVLIRDVAYDSLPKRDRGALHLAVAEWAEEALGERLEEYVELLAAHYVAALRYEEEFGTDPSRTRRIRERTLDHVRRAAARAYRLGQLESATAWVNCAVEQARRLPLQRRELASVIEEYATIGYANTSGAAAAPVIAEGLDALLGLDLPTGDDRVRIARLRAALGRALYQAQRPDEARSVLEAGIAGDPPAIGRAELLATLGWLDWRLGRSAEAIPLLEQAIGVATEAGADAILRTAVHDLGVARVMNRDPAGIGLIARSFSLAKAAGDANLLTRCYINFPSVKMHNGDDWREIVPVLEEGLDRVRRSVDRGGTAWIAGNFADLLEQLGRLPEAKAIWEESVAAARLLGDREILAGRLIGLASVTLLLGDRAAAEALVTDEVRALAWGEVQTLPYAAVFDAWLAWPDADRAIGLLLKVAGRSSLVPNADVIAAQLGRAALRSRRGDALATAVAVADAMRRPGSGPLILLVAEAVAALADPSEAGLGRVVASAASLEERGYRLPAAEAFADAAVVAASLGLDPLPHARRARDLFAASSAVPPFGDPVTAAVIG